MRALLRQKLMASAGVTCGWNEPLQTQCSAPSEFVLTQLPGGCTSLTTIYVYQEASKVWVQMCGKKCTFSDEIWASGAEADANTNTERYQFSVKVPGVYIPRRDGISCVPCLDAQMSVRAEDEANFQARLTNEPFGCAIYWNYRVVYDKVGAAKAVDKFVADVANNVTKGTIKLYDSAGNALDSTGKAAGKGIIDWKNSESPYRFLGRW